MNTCPHCRLRNFGTCPLLAQGIVCPHCYAHSLPMASGMGMGMGLYNALMVQMPELVRFRPMTRSEARDYFLPEDNM